MIFLIDGRVRMDIVVAKFSWSLRPTVPVIMITLILRYQRHIKQGGYGMRQRIP
jgi:hypothetical protein